MQFITDGPDIPDALLQAHEEGRVVFFCGAGISYPAGLPGFKGLVEKIYEFAGTTLFEIEREAFGRSQFDATLDLLERRYPGQRLAVRRTLVQALKPKLRRKGATDTQAALLRLSRSRDGSLRLVTTNFDRVFHSAAKRINQPFQEYAAPMLPIPKSSRWDGIVYLHGLLSERPDDSTLNRLVLTSGDFGLAYLTERWAARFVSELFRNYVVCFVGYSINDPVLRYMMDALAADRMLGETSPQAWALGDCEPGQEHRKAIEWAAKGVTPILYQVIPGTNDHSKLHKTLHTWADTYRDGVLGKERIVINHALAQPAASTQQDDFVGRILWALSDKSGLPAKRFAEFNPAPSLDWLLGAFTVRRFGYSDLARFNVPPHDTVDQKLSFSLTHRPVAYDRAPPMVLVSTGVTFSELDSVMTHLARWLTRHLDDPRLIHWVAGNGGVLHNSLKWMIEQTLNRISTLERDGKTAELDEIRLHAPNAIPGPMMRTLWRLILSGRAKSPWENSDLYSWKDRLERDGLTTTLRLELRELLAPKVALKKPFRWGAEDEHVIEPQHIRQLVDWEIMLTANHVSSSVKEFAEDERWHKTLPILLPDFQQCLLDTLDLLNELGAADELSDRSPWDLPSIEPHWQNRGFHDWVSLIELVRDAWLAILAEDDARATRIAQSWFESRYPTFKRLAFFAASKTAGIPDEQWVSWLVKADAWWLWSEETMREMFRLLVLRGIGLSAVERDRIEAAILSGPPRDMYRADLEPEQWRDIVDRSVWLRLAKLSLLSAEAATRLAELSTAFPNWQLAANDSDEFFHWMTSTGDPDYEDSRDVDIAPRDRHDLIQWLKKPISGMRPFYEDTWREVCRSCFADSLGALQDLAAEGIWPISRWRDALSVWSEGPMILQSWKEAAPLVNTFPNNVLQDIVHALTWWMEAASESSDDHVDIMLSLCHRVLDYPLEADNGSRIIRDGIQIYDPVSSAINHPVGHITKALLNLWMKRNPNDNDHLPIDLKPYFTDLCNPAITRFRNARVLMGSRAITFYRVDRAWTEQNLLPLFNWQQPIEAKGVWEGFLWSPRLYTPLLVALKLNFLESAKQYNDLGEHRQQFAAFLTFAALGRLEGYSDEEFRTAIGVLPREGLEGSAQALSQAIEGSAEQREEYWKNHIRPFWQNIWPKSLDLATPKIADSLARMLIASRSEFQDAFAAVRNWILPVEHPDHIVRSLSKSDLCLRFPQTSLHFLAAAIANPRWIGRDLGNCLDQIASAAPDLLEDGEYRRLQELFRRLT